MITELIAYVAAVVAVAVTALLVGDDGNDIEDSFNAEQALRYITFLTIGYMIAVVWRSPVPRPGARRRLAPDSDAAPARSTEAGRSGWPAVQT